MSWREIMGPNPSPNIPTIPKTPSKPSSAGNSGDIGDRASPLEAAPRIDTALSGPSQKFNADDPRRCWIIVEPSGARWSSSFTPPATLAEVLAGYSSGTEAVPGRQLKNGRIVEAEEVEEWARS